MTQNKDKYQQPGTYCPEYEAQLLGKSRQKDRSSRPVSETPTGLKLRIAELRAEGLISGDPSGRSWDSFEHNED